jgi:uncharacterized protein YydD (DUF2326 family)
MKLSKIYSNNDDVFKPILFNEGFNVIYGKVKKPKDSDKDSHNLGKTILIHLIDFLLLKKLNKRQHFLLRNAKLFRGLEFYLEILLNSGDYLTIKRSVDSNTKIFLKKHKEKYQNFTSLKSNEWDNNSIPLRKAITLFDSYLNLTSIHPWSYRKGVSYFLRTQTDYSDVFQISKYSVGEHAEWKPYLAKLLGFNDTLLKEKYDIDNKIQTREEYKSEYEKTLTTKSEEYDKLRGAIEIKQIEIKEASEKFDKFNFYEKELKINTELVEEVETEISTLNNNLYNVKYEIEKINESLSARIKFNLDEVKQIFEETKLYFPNQLLKSYTDLVNFNLRLSEERNKHLNERLQILKQEQNELIHKLKELNLKREDLLKILRGEDTFNKFRLLQKSLVNQQTELVRLQSQLENLDSISVIEKEIEVLKQKQKELIIDINQQIKVGNALYSDIRVSFNKIIKYVLNLPALLSIRSNREGNMEFKAEIVKDETSLKATNEGEGTTYKKFLCAAFDIAVLKVYAPKSFFKFVYHDGMLEGLDNRKKICFLDLVRDYCNNYGLQYILTVIDADLPRDENDKKIQFTKEEIIRELSDEGQKGRLFNMPIF